MTATAEVQDRPESPRFAWDDPFLLNDQLSEDERMIRDTARDYAQGRLHHCGAAIQTTRG